MSVAVKTPPESTPSYAYDRLAVASLAGVAYVLLGVGAVGYAIPKLWHQWIASEVLGGVSGMTSGVLLLLMVMAALVGLFYIGHRLLRSCPIKGVRAGIAVGVTAIFLLGLLTVGIGFMLESWLFNNEMFGDNGLLVGAIITIVLGALFLFLLCRSFFRPGFQFFLSGFEEQGWFTATTYKRNQGQRVRRGTILGILILVGSGIYVLGNPEHGTLRGYGDLKVAIPFTGSIRVTASNVGDQIEWNKELKEMGENAVLVKDRIALRNELRRFADNYVKIGDVGDPRFARGEYGFVPGKVVERRLYDKAVKEADSAAGTQKPKPPTKSEAWEWPSDKAAIYQSIVLLPLVQFSLPFLLTVLTIWFAWRLVNVPAFADFLIATEAELNKVSWTTRARLYQDTIVVLVTVVLMAIFLLIADAGWGTLLRKIDVLHGGGSGPMERKAGSRW